ncbi:MAG: TIR domain-containing protein, partial [Firmicutes bacterium]|nr:TIR domain-containing protein [Bacillota bacterium]
MAIFKCKMCGGTIEFEPSATVGVCDSCGTKQTLPRLDSDRKSNLYDRANHFRRNNDFDKAMGIYEQILNEDNTDAEAYWSLVLCRYGIEYVEDPATHKRIPTVNRAQYTSIYMDEDYKAALQYADVYQRQVYEEEAKTIDDIQKGILEISNKEKPFDVFICYKETDNNGRRTQDSVLANDLYHQLTQEGFKVFFSRITLEDKLGTAYEPYIFAALNSAKVMVVLGTKPEYFNAVWVKNEWSRYLSLVKKSNGKKMLIPAYRDMDPYDLPEEFSHLQAQDMSKLGFMQDLIRGIKKIIGSEPIQQVTQKSITAAPAYGSNVDALLKRGNMALEDHEWQKADNFFEEVLNQNAECSAAYLGKWMAAEKQTNLFMLFSTIGERFNKTETQTIEACPADNEHINYMIDHNQIPGYLERSEIRKQYDFDRTYQSDVVSRETQKNGLVDWLNAERLYTRALEYASESEKAKLEKNVTDLMQLMDDRIEKARRDAEENAYLIRENYKKHLGQADQYVHEIRQKAETEQEVEYQQIVQQKKEAKTISEYEKIKEKLNLMKGYKDTEVLANECQTEIERLQEEKRQEKERIQEKQRQADI